MSDDGEHGDESDYVGPATLTIDGTTIEVEADLRGHFQPIDGMYRWYGKLRPNDALDAAVGRRRATGTLRTSGGEAEATVSDRDLWGRYRVEGRNRPPFHVPTTLAEVEAHDTEET